jgi:hypothetical protein
MTTSSNGVDLAKREIYLSDADFQANFGMDKEAWGKLAGWKKTGLKKKAGLF